MKIFVATVAFIAIATLSAKAEDAAPAPKPPAPATGTTPGHRWAACAPEIEKYCANIERGPGRMRTCLEGHVSELSDACKARVAEPHS